MTSLPSSQITPFQAPNSAISDPPQPTKESIFAKSPITNLFQSEVETGFKLNKLERVIAEAYGKTLSVKAVIEKVTEMFPARRKPQVTYRFIRHKLEKSHVRAAYQEILRDNTIVYKELTEEKWLAMGAEMMMRTPFGLKVDKFIWKEYGKAKGWYKEGEGQGTQIINAIHVTQANGER